MLRANFYQKLLSAVVVVSLFTACAGQRGNSKTVSSSQMPQTSLSSIDRVGDASIETPKSIKSVYTSLDLENCEVLKTYEESGGQALRCKGYQDIPLYVTQGDARFDVDAGVPNSEWTTSGRPFNSIGDTVEWRIHDGKPVAIILRYNFQTGRTPQERSSELAVISVGREGSPGCLVEWVPGDAKPSQNVAARQIADRKAESFNCGSNLSAKPRTENVTPSSSDSSQTTTITRLPNSVTGKFDRTQAQCSERITMSRLTISQEKLDFYYGYATVNTVTFRDGGYDISATLFQLEGQVEVRPEAVEYRIEPDVQDGDIRFGAVSLNREPSPLVRCDEP